MISKVSRNMYTMLENMAEREIERDPIGFIREESFLKPNGPQKNTSQEFEGQFEFEQEQFEDLQVETYEQAEGMNERELAFKKKKSKQDMYDPDLVEELEEVFQSAHENFVSTFMSPKKLLSQNRKPNLIEEEETKGEEVTTGQQLTETRDTLPFFKDPKVKISIWTIIKDSIGKDLSKMTVPVYFNSPLSLLQQCACPTEHIELLGKAATETNPIKRLAYIGCYLAVQHTNIEKFPSKPFNPLLGETFELVVPGEYKYIAEQVCHHPPITAYIVKGDKGFTRETVYRARNKFSKGALAFSNMFKEYINLTNFNERFTIEPCDMSVHNLIIGSPYLDAGGRGYIRNVSCPTEQYVEITFHKRGWSAGQHHRLNGDVYSAPGVVAYRIEGKWSDTIYLTDVKTGEKETVWKKPPYPENSDYMYGMSQHQLQFNFLSPSLEP